MTPSEFNEGTEFEPLPFEVIDLEFAPLTELIKARDILQDSGDDPALLRTIKSILHRRGF